MVFVPTSIDRVPVWPAASRTRWSRSPNESPEPTGLVRVLNRKWYVDELYDAIIVRPVLSTSRALWKVIDQGIIDGTVNGLGRASRMIARLISRAL